MSALRISPSVIGPRKNDMAQRGSSNVVFGVAWTLRTRNQRGPSLRMRGSTMELKWYIAPGDYREVLNRNEAAEESLKRQLPKYTAALREHGCQLIGDAFGQVALVDRITWSCGLVMKNLVGTAKLRAYTDAWFAPESALVAQVTRCDNPRQLVSNMKQFIWVPPRAKMIIRKNSVMTPSGFELVMPGYELPETPSNVVAFSRWRSASKRSERCGDQR